MTTPLEHFLDFETLVAEVAEWQARKFPDSGPEHCFIGIIEEMGELAHASLKREQRIAGTEQELAAEALDAAADMVIYSASLVALMRSRPFVASPTYKLFRGLLDDVTRCDPAQPFGVEHGVQALHERLADAIGTTLPATGRDDLVEVVWRTWDAVKARPVDARERDEPNDRAPEWNVYDAEGKRATFRPFPDEASARAHCPDVDGWTVRRG